MNKKKVLFVVNNFNIGGPQKSLLSLIHQLDFDKLNIDLMILNGENQLIDYLPNEVNILHTSRLIKYATLSPKTIKKHTIKMLLTKDIYFVLQAIPLIMEGLIQGSMTRIKQKYWVQVRRKLPKNPKKYDVAIGVSGGHSMMYISDCVEAKKKIGWIRTDYRVLKRNHTIDSIYFQQMHAIIAVSELTKNIFIELFPNEKNKVEVIYNPLPFAMYKNIKTDPTLISKEKSHIKLLTISRLDPNKGIDLAINTLELLLAKGYDIKWYLLGSGVLEKQILKLIKEKNLENKFILLGFQFNTAVFIQECDIVVHPSYFEGKSNVIDEAKYLLKPIVATNFETVNEQLINNVNGLISEMNPLDLSRKIEQLINNRKLHEQFKINLLKEKKDDTSSLKKFYKIIDLE